MRVDAAARSAAAWAPRIRGLLCSAIAMACSSEMRCCGLEGMAMGAGGSAPVAPNAVGEGACPKQVSQGSMTTKERVELSFTP